MTNVEATIVPTFTYSIDEGNWSYLDTMATKMENKWNEYISDTLTVRRTTDYIIIDRNAVCSGWQSQKNWYQYAANFSTDVCLFVDAHNYAGFGGCSIIGSATPKENDDPAGMAIVGYGAINEWHGLHEILHTFNAEHFSHSKWGIWEKTLMGLSHDSSVSCNNNNTPNYTVYQINSSTGQYCTTGRVEDYIDSNW